MRSYVIPKQQIAKSLLATTFAGMAITPFAIAKSVDEGLPYAAFQRAANHLNQSERALANLTGIAPSTLSHQKNSKNARLSIENSEKLYRYVNLLQRSIEVFNDEDYAKKWFESANDAFEGKSPAEIARNEVGAEAVRDLLIRIEYGVFS